MGPARAGRGTRSIEFLIGVPKLVLNHRRRSLGAKDEIRLRGQRCVAPARGQFQPVAVRRSRLHAIEARGEPGGEALARFAMDAAQHPAHRHKAVDRALEAHVVDRHARRLERRGVFRAFVAQGIVPCGHDQRRREAGVVRIERRACARIGEGPRGPEIMVEEPADHVAGDRKLPGELFARGQAPAQVERGIDQGLRPDPRRERALRFMQRDGREPAAGAVAGNRDAFGIEPHSRRLARQPMERGDSIFDRGGERMFRRKPVIERKHACARVVAQRAAEDVVRADVAENAAAAMHEENGRLRLAAGVEGRVPAQPHRPGRTRDSEIDRLADRGRGDLGLAVRAAIFRARGLGRERPERRGGRRRRPIEQRLSFAVELQEMYPGPSNERSIGRAMQCAPWISSTPRPGPWALAVARSISRQVYGAPGRHQN
jgi:hypothetical protein